MTGKQHAVMWLGIILVIVRLFTTNQWSILWSTFTTNPNPGGPGNQPSDNLGQVPMNIADSLQNIAHIGVVVGPLGYVNVGAQKIASDIVKHL